jgi:feruloyl-CoA synthase
LLDTPPSLDAGEMTDKGNISQRIAIERRSDAIAMLYREPPPPPVVVL